MSVGLFGFAGRLARDDGLSQQNVGGGCGDVMHLRDDLFELLPVGDPGAVEHLTPAQVLAAYRYQPNLERRHHMLKGPQQVAPVFLENAHRIEALLLCHFLAMLTEALIEREIRNSMKTQALTGIPLY